MSIYSPIVDEHFGRPRNIGKPERFGVKGVAGNPNAGPFMVIYATFKGEDVAGAWYETYGCAAAIAAGSFLTELIKGKPALFAQKIDAPTLMNCLGGLPLGKQHCASLAVDALQDALRQRGMP